MSIWNDLFEIYQSVQSADDTQPTNSSNPQIVPAKKAAVTDEDNEPAQPTVYVFAYIDDGKGNISRNIAVEDRITMLELKNQELETRYNRLLEELEDSEDSNQL